MVESCVPDERGRLNRLLTYTSGAAKELVRTCVYFNDQECYTTAMQLVHQEFGNKQKIARAYIQQLKDLPSVKGSDLEGWNRMHRFLLNCITFKSTGQLAGLDRPDILCAIITNFKPSFQDRWTTVAERIERTQEREKRISTTFWSSSKYSRLK